MVTPQRRFAPSQITTLALTVAALAEYAYFVFTAFANLIAVQNVFFAHHLDIPASTAFAIRICAVASMPATILLIPITYAALAVVRARREDAQNSYALPITAIILLTIVLTFVKIAFTLPH